MKQEIKLGRTDYTVQVFIPDPASTDGSGKTGLAHSDMTVSFSRVETDNDVVITDATSSLNALTNLTDAHNDWGWKEVSNTLAPGLYRLDIADAVFASGAWSAVVYVMITSSAAAASPMEFILVAYDPLDTVRLGLTALPNAAADAAGGLPISDAGGLDLDAKIGALTFGTANRVNAQVYGMENNTVTAAAIADNAIDAGAIAADAITAAKVAADVGAEIADAVWDEDATGHQTQGTFGQAIGDPGADTDTIWALANTNLDATVSSRLASAGYTAPLDAAGTRAAVGLASANLDTQLDATATPADILTTALTESYSALGGQPTLTQAIYQILSMLQEKGVSSTTLTTKKRDGSTTAMTFTLDDATNPTSITRAS